MQNPNIHVKRIFIADKIIFNQIKVDKGLFCVFVTLFSYVCVQQFLCMAFNETFFLNIYMLKLNALSVHMHIHLCHGN